MAVEQPDRFDIKDLYLDVRLEALVDGEPYDFTGRRHFTAGFFRENIGFGITNIRIEVNTSLQPIVEITFMDLYGNTMFGGQYNDSNVDYSSFFRWPPPKFMFTFKGYLGRPVTWMLNLKQYDINFISEKGHYELKASFVPNQWGFFADIPFMYLLAAKRLRMGAGQTQDQAMSIYDLIKIGQRVEIKRSEVTKKYDGLLKQMSDIYSNLCIALADSKTVSMGSDIVGRVDGRTVKNFKVINIEDVTKKPGFGLNSLEDILLQAKGPNEQNLINQFLFTKMLIDGAPGKYSSLTLDQFKALPSNERDAEKYRCIEVIQNNIKAINEESLADAYDVTKEELGKITISQVFRQIAKDAAYIMGRILQAGFKGSSNDQTGSGSVNREEERRGSSDSKTDLVGQSYPLGKDDEGSEIPAFDTKYGITEPGCEMDFVREFISAVIEGIAKDLPDEKPSDALLDDRLTARVSNLEANASSNAYRPLFDSIEENVIVRSGIAAYMTRSYDPNLPGDYDDRTLLLPTNFDRDSVESIKKLAESDVQNVTDNMIQSLSAKDTEELRVFTTFFDKLLSDDGEDFLTADGKKIEFLKYRTNTPKTDVNPEVLNYRVVMNFPNGFKPEDLNTQEKISAALVSKQLSESDCLSVGQYISGSFAFQNAMKGFLDNQSLTARRLVNNSTIYTYPHNPSDDYFILVYEGDDARSVKGKNTTQTDSEFAETGVDKDRKKARGLIEITNYSDENGDVLGRVKNFNDYVSKGLALDYAALKRMPSNMRENGRFGDAQKDQIEYDPNAINHGLPKELDALLWKKKVVAGQVNDIVYTVLYHKGNSDRVVFGPFIEGDRARNQRVYIKTMCVELRKKLQSVERIRQQKISRILGSANEHEYIIYKQFHSLFHQWSTLAYTDSIGSDGTYNGSSILANGNGIAEELQGLYGGEGEGHLNTRHVSIADMTGEQVQDLEDPTFIYDYPLQRIREMDGSSKSTIDVRDSIINIDPLYNPDGNTTVLNMLYNICSKNNFMFIPIPGYAGYLNVKDVYKPYVGQIDTRIRNFFHVLFMPTPESRSMISNKTYSAPLTFRESDTQRDIKGDAIGVRFGAVDNQIIKNVSVGTRDNKVTAESIVNLQRLTDNEDQNKTVTKDCSMLNVMGGRSYTSRIDTLGNAQIYPMQFYFLEKMPMFDGLYQIMKVEHTIQPNNMSTTFEGIRMRFNPGGYSAIPPVTLGSLQKLSDDRPQPQVEQSDVNVQGDSFRSSPDFEHNAITTTADVEDLKSQYQNGRLPESILTESVFMRNGGYIGSNKAPIKYKLTKDAARSLDQLMEAFKGASFKGKQKAYVKDGYRTYQEQTYLYNNPPTKGQAAVPGTSNHGWGIAVDFWWGMPVAFRKRADLRIAAFTHPNYKWFMENAHRFGWVNPTGLRDGSRLEEWWHWEYHGPQDPPEVLVAEYAKPFDFDYVPTLKANGASFVV